MHLDFRVVKMWKYVYLPVNGNLNMQYVCCESVSSSSWAELRYSLSFTQCPTFIYARHSKIEHKTSPRVSCWSVYLAPPEASSLKKLRGFHPNTLRFTGVPQSRQLSPLGEPPWTKAKFAQLEHNWTQAGASSSRLPRQKISTGCPLLPPLSYRSTIKLGMWGSLWQTATAAFTVEPPHHYHSSNPNTLVPSTTWYFWKKQKEGGRGSRQGRQGWPLPLQLGERRY